jgi:hypothetical protein
MWIDRVDRLKQLRACQPRDPYAWIPASELRCNDRFQFGGDWFRVIDTSPVDPHVQTTAACGHLKTVIDYLAFESVKVMLPRPATTPRR